MFISVALAALYAALPVLSSPLSTNNVEDYSQNAVRPSVHIGPQNPWFPMPISPPRFKVCVVPSHNNLVTDDTPAILSAMHECNYGGRVVFPPDITYTIGTAMDLTFLRSIDIDLQGTWLFTNNTNYWQKNGFFQVFQNATTFFQLGGYDVNFYGGGTINGNGQVWYDLYAENEYILRPILFGTIGLHDSIISNLNLRYSPQYYNFVANSSSVVFSDISIYGESVSANPAKNTDGWDTYRSNNIVIQNSNIYNQDDCVSFKPNSTYMLVQNLQCTGSHGISVGSLGQYVGQYDLVQDVLVYNITLTNVSDGARIKVWPGSPAELSGDLQGGGGTGLVKNIVYDTLVVNNADYSIEVTQCYGQTNLTLCDEYPSLLQIEDVLIRNVRGTSSTKYDNISGYVQCSSPDVCTDIVLEDIDVVAPNGTVNLFTCGNVNEALLMGIDCTTVNYGYN